MRFFSARLNLDKGILLNFKFFLVNLFQYKTAVQRQAADGFHLDFHFAAAPSPGFVRTTPPTENPVAGPVFSIGGVV